MTVVQADFLQLGVTPRGSSAVIDQPNVHASDGISNSNSNAGVLLSLPAASYDAAVLSLVLSYIPLPTQRAAVIAKARQLLTTPESDASIGARLVIIEPYSTATGGRRCVISWQAVHNCGITPIRRQQRVRDHNGSSVYS